MKVHLISEFNMQKKIELKFVYLVSSNDAIFILEMSTSECAFAMTLTSLFFITFEVFHITTIYQYIKQIVSIRN